MLGDMVVRLRLTEEQLRELRSLREGRGACEGGGESPAFKVLWGCGAAGRDGAERWLTPFGHWVLEEAEDGRRSFTVSPAAMGLSTQEQWEGLAPPPLLTGVAYGAPFPEGGGEDWTPPRVRVTKEPGARLVPLVKRLREVWPDTPLSAAAEMAREGFERELGGSYEVSELRKALAGLAKVEDLR